VITIMPLAHNQTRARAQADSVQTSLIYLPEAAPWLLHYEQELTRFPSATHNNRVDSTSQFLTWIKSKQHQAQPNIRPL
jgi:phage terminase large subunit-like protein